MPKRPQWEDGCSRRRALAAPRRSAQMAPLFPETAPTSSRSMAPILRLWTGAAILRSIAGSLRRGAAPSMRSGAEASRLSAADAITTRTPLRDDIERRLLAYWPSNLRICTASRRQLGKQRPCARQLEAGDDL